MTSPATIFWTTAAFAFVFGTLIGSFLNVVIYRVPAGLSIVSPGSRCPSCETPIRWYDNIPIVSWVLLGRKCRACGVAIAARYALVELLTGLLAFGVWYQAASGLLDLATLPAPEAFVPSIVSFLLRFTFAALLVAITFVDFDHYIIPHGFTLPGIVLGLLSPWILEWVMGPVGALQSWPPVTPISSLAGAIGGFVSVVGIFYFYLAWRGVEGIGGGDATLMALVGAWLGWPSLIFVFFAASLQGVIVAGLSMLFGVDFVKDSAEIFADEEDAPDDEAPEKPANAADAVTAGASSEELDAAAELPAGKMAVPFGPFICAAALEFLLFGPLLPPELSLVYLYF